MRHEDMTVDELIAEYNSHGPAEPIERWDGEWAKLAAMVLEARKQSTPDGIVASVTVRFPKDDD